MKKLLFIPVLLASIFFGNQARACYANYTHTNACAGDTFWFYAADLYAVQYWDFGDTASGADNIAFGDSSFHVFSAPGTYLVTHFVDIGAEWAYETQVVTVGTDCFNASFTANCSGDLYMLFTSTSTGSGLTYAWDFGEPSSGAANTSTLLNPAHYYGASGSYTVSLIITDGSSIDTMTQTVAVDSPCLSASYSYMMGTCVGDTFHFTSVYYSASVTGATWDFGDGTTGSGLNPSHYYATAGLYMATVTYTDGSSTAVLNVPVLMEDCTVWPGDCNDDGETGGEDIFPIGIYHGGTGVPRPGATTGFSSQACTDWGSTAGSYSMYLQGLVNFKNADANGDGTINESDLAAITLNFGMHHNNHNNRSSMQGVLPSDPAFAIQLPAVSYTRYDGSTNDADLMLGDAAIPAGYTYGYSVSIPYGPYVNPTTITVDFNGTWLDSVASPHLITWYYNDLVNHVLHIACVRNNNMAVAGYGAVAHIHYNTFPGWSGPMTWAIDPSAKFLSNQVVGGDGPATSPMGYVQRYMRARLVSGSSDVTLGVNDIHTTDANLVVSPVPAAKMLNISMKNNEKISGVTISNSIGQQVLKAVPVNGSIDVSTLSNGIYLMQVNTAARTYQQKIEIVR